MGNSELKMLRALLLPNQALASEVKDLTSKSVPKLTGDGQEFGPDADQIEKERKDLEIILKPPTKAPEPIKPYIEIFPGDPVEPQQIPTTEKPEIQTKETFPDLSEELNKPQIQLILKKGKEFLEFATHIKNNCLYFDYEVTPDTIDLDIKCLYWNLRELRKALNLKKNEPIQYITLNNETFTPIYLN